MTGSSMKSLDARFVIAIIVLTLSLGAGFAYQRAVAVTHDEAEHVREALTRSTTAFERDDLAPLMRRG